MTEESISKQLLQTKLDLIKSSVLPENRWYYHIEGVENFIYHLDNFPSERTKYRVSKDIFEYLCQVEEKLSENREPGPSMKELTPSFWKISQVYKLELGFSRKPFYPFLLGWLIILFLVLNHFYSLVFSLVFVLVLFLSRMVYAQIKIRAKKIC